MQSILELFGGGSQSPAEAAMPYLEGIPEQIKPYYEPYIQAGQQALPGLQEQLQRLVSQPTDVMSQIGGQFQASPGYQFQVDQATRAANQAAAAGGMVGTPQNQYQAMQSAQQLANQDYYNYMSRGLGLYGQGLAGTQALSGQGLQAGGALAGQLANIAGSQAKLAYAGQQAQEQQAGGLMGMLGGVAGTVLGGPIGGAIGGGIGKLFEGGSQPNYASGGDFGGGINYGQGGGFLR